MSRDVPAPGDGLLEYARKVSTMDLDAVKVMVIASSVLFEDDGADDRGFPTQDEIDEVQVLWTGNTEIIFMAVNEDYDTLFADGDYASMAFLTLLLDRINELAETEMS